MIKVLFVCLGNICRSPLAGGVFKEKVKEKGLIGHIKVDSAGTSGFHLGEDPDPRSCEIAKENGIELKHSGRQLVRDDFENYDYILAMDKSNYEDILNLKKHSGMSDSEVVMFRDFDNSQSGEDIPDPYYGGKDGFEKVYQLIEESSENFLDYLKEKHQFNV